MKGTVTLSYTPIAGIVDDIEARLSASRCFSTIISGRAVKDLYSRIRVEGIIYAGNHGLGIFGRNLRFVEERLGKTILPLDHPGESVVSLS